MDIFGIGGPELIVILVIAGIVMGPARIAQFARWLGKTTSYLQNVSRGFAMQLRSELEAIDEGGDMQNMLREMRDLQKEVNDLRRSVRDTATGVVKEANTAVNETVKEGQDVVNAIAPPKLIESVKPTSSNGSKSTTPAPPPSNGTSAESSPAAPAPPPLPSIVEVPDDPE